MNELKINKNFTHFFTITFSISRVTQEYFLVCDEFINKNIIFYKYEPMDSKRTLNNIIIQQFVSLNRCNNKLFFH